MNDCFISSDDAKNLGADELFKRLESSPDGLKETVASERLKTCGSNLLEEKKRSFFLVFLSYFWGPIPWMIELAALLSAILHHWPNLIIILILLIANGLIGFFEEFQAGNAVEALKKNLALKSLVKRDGAFKETESSHIVPGDIIRLRPGNVIPADAKLLDGDYLSVDQSALTGESLPISKKSGDLVYSGSIAKQGEMQALVISTGKNTFFGKTAKLVESAGAASHFQKAVLQIGRYLIFLSLSLALILITVQLFRGASFLELIQFVIILIVASIPVAMPAVLSVTMALGALRLSKLKAIVTKLESIEEMAGVDMLCSDKTGTLTQNKLRLGDPVVFNKADPNNLLKCACLASKEENKDPIDLAIIAGFPDQKSLSAFKQTAFKPFDPTIKRTEATIVAPEGNTFFVTKGAPQVILSLCTHENDLAQKIQESIDSFASKGYRTLGVASSPDQKTWQFLGLLTLSDPLREDSKSTVQQAGEHGIQIKMLTGDNLAIAKEIAKELEIGDKIESADKLKELGEQTDTINGFAQVFPEHKYEIVKALQNRKHIVAMTGDGVNDSPALKQADVGIAVSGATDAARAAASLVLTEPGLSVIIHAIEEARRIFERMNSYAIYRIAETIRIMFFMTLCILIYNFYPITAMMIILLALLNDLPIMTIVYDHTLLSLQPVRWNMKRVLSISSSLGIIGILESFLLVWIAKTYLPLTLDQLQSLIFLKLSVAGHLTLFVARTKNGFYSKPYPSPILFSAIVATQIIAALFVGLGIYLTAVPWSYIGYLWIYALFWMGIEDGIKRALYKLFEKISTI